MAGLGELFIQLGVFADTKELQAAEKRLANFVKTGTKGAQRVNTKLADVTKGIGAVVGALTAAGYALNRLTNDLVQSNQAMLNLTRTSDISLSTFQKWGSIGKMLGVNNAAQQIEGLNQRLFELRLTGQGARGFQLAGINPTGDAEDVMEQLRNRVSGMDDTSAAYLLREMGLDPQMLHLLRLGREEFEALGETVKKYQLTEEQRAEIQRMNIQLEIARQKLQYLKDRAVLKLMPVLVELIKSFARITEFIVKAIKKFKELSIVWHGVIVSIIYGLGHIKQVQIIFKGILSSCNGLVRSIPFVGKFFGKLGSFALKAMLPLTLLYLILDDLATYFEGGDSLVGRVIDWGKDKGSQIGDAFKKMFGGDIAGGLGDFGETFEQILEDINTILEKMFNLIANFVTLGLWEKLQNSLPNGKDFSANPIYLAFPWLNPKMIKKQLEGVTGEATGGAAGITLQGYEGVLPSLEHRNIVSPAPEQAVTNSVANNSNLTNNINMNNYFNTNECAFDIERELRYVTAQFAYSG